MELEVIMYWEQLHIYHKEEASMGLSLGESQLSTASSLSTSSHAYIISLQRTWINVAVSHGMNGVLWVSIPLTKKPGSNGSAPAHEEEIKVSITL